MNSDRYHPGGVDSSSSCEGLRLSCATFAEGLAIPSRFGFVPPSSSETVTVELPRGIAIIPVRASSLMP